MIPTIALGQTGLTARAATIRDGSFASVSLLLHMDGTHGSTTFTDHSPTPKTMTAVGGGALSTAQAKFGTASGLFAVTGDRVSTPSDAAFLFGTGDWTAEAWVYVTAYSTSGQIVGMHRYGTDNSWIMMVTAAGKLEAYNGASSAATGTTTVTLNAWHHVAVCRASGTRRLFLDGGLEASGSDSYNYASYTQALTIGCDATGNANAQFQGYIDDVRVTKGVARYAAAFTVPSAAFPNS